MSRFLNIAIVLSFLISAGMQAQTMPDSLIRKTDTLTQIKTNKILTESMEMIQDSVGIKPFKPDPMRAVWMGAIIPGYGQIINKKYWKLPFVYGAFLGCAYAISWNGSQYNSYRTAYRDITDNNPATNSFLDILPPGFTIDSPGIGGISTLTSTLKSKQDNFRRYRDLSVIVTIGCYALSLIDAYVDAQLYDFDISPNLSMRLQPTLLEGSRGMRNTLGMQCCISLK